MRALGFTLFSAFLACGQAPPDPAPSAVVVSGSVSAASASVDAPDAEQRWSGRIAVPGGTSLLFGLRFRGDRAEAATLGIPAQRLEPTALRDVVITPESMSFTLPIVGAPESAFARFTIERKPGAEVAEGTMKQNGATMPVTLHRLDEKQSLLDEFRPQTPRPPFPYQQREATFTSRDGTKLAGTLTLPAGTAKHPAVLLISGTGEQDRDGTLFDHRFFLVIADHLTRAGIAVLRVDDRGVGGSQGSTSKTGFAGKVDDALSAMAWLASQPELDAQRIGLLGHSEGGLLAPLVEVRSQSTAPTVAFIVLLAAPGVPGRELLIKQMDQTLRAQKVSAERLAIGNQGQKKAVDAVVSGADDAALRAIVEAQLDAVIKLEPGTRPNFLKKSAMIEQGLVQLASPAMRDFIRSNPGPTLEKVRCPVLALGGTLDLQVPGEENVAAIRAALERGHNPDITTVVFPGHNHLFQPALIGTSEEWFGIETTIDPEVLKAMSSWLRTRAGLER